MIKVGDKVNLQVKSKKVGEYTVKVYTLDDPAFEQEVKATYANYRIMLPGQAFTTEYKMGRTNIRIDANGTIVSINAG